MVTWREQLNLRGRGLHRREPVMLADALRSLVEGPDRVGALTAILVRLLLLVLWVGGTLWFLRAAESASPRELVGIIVLLVLGLVLRRWLKNSPPSENRRENVPRSRAEP